MAISFAFVDNQKCIRMYISQECLDMLGKMSTFFKKKRKCDITQGSQKVWSGVSVFLSHFVSCSHELWYELLPYALHSLNLAPSDVSCFWIWTDGFLENIHFKYGGHRWNKIKCTVQPLLYEPCWNGFLCNRTENY